MNQTRIALGAIVGGAMHLLIIALIIVAIVLILGSTAILHFWVLTGMGTIALRELPRRPESSRPADPT